MHKIVLFDETGYSEIFWKENYDSLMKMLETFSTIYGWWIYPDFI
jgi:hypothetical protein